MAVTYGISFAAKLLQQERYDEALLEAERAIGRDESDPEAWFEKASALSALSRHGEVLPAIARAHELDEEEQMLDTDALDDCYFSSLLALAREEAEKDVSRGVARLEEYHQLLPSGRHQRDVSEWQMRLRGELKSEFKKDVRD